MGAGIATRLAERYARWYAEKVRQFGHPDRVRQLYTNRGDHGAFSAADEIVALRTLLSRLDTGHWPNTNPDRLNAEVATFTPPQQTVFILAG